MDIFKTVLCLALLLVSNPVLTPYANAQEEAASVSTKGNFCIVLLKDHSMLAWGQNSKGQLGIGTTRNRSVPVPVGKTKEWSTVSAGWDHVIALKTDGSLWAWGDNTFGQLGDGSTINSSRPKKIGNKNDWTAVEAGEDFSVALKSDGSLWTWGRNHHGQLGNGDKNRLPVFVPVKADSHTDWKSISAFFAHVLAIKKDGTLWGWGNNSYHQTGSTSETSRLVPAVIDKRSGWIQASAGDSHSLALRSDGTLWSTGRNAEGQLGNGAEVHDTGSKTLTRIGTDTDWAQISGGGFHSLAVKRNGTIWGWGHNREGQVGVAGSSTKTITTPTRIDSSSDWVVVEAGNDHSLALKSDGTLYGWGWNLYGQIGTGKNKLNGPPFVTRPVQVSYTADRF